MPDTDTTEQESPMDILILTHEEINNSSGKEEPVEFVANRESYDAIWKSKGWTILKVEEAAADMVVPPVSLTDEQKAAAAAAEAEAAAKAKKEKTV